MSAFASSVWPLGTLACLIMFTFSFSPLVNLIAESILTSEPLMDSDLVIVGFSFFDSLPNHQIILVVQSFYYISA